MESRFVIAQGKDIKIQTAKVLVLRQANVRGSPLKEVRAAVLFSALALPILERSDRSGACFDSIESESNAGIRMQCHHDAAMHPAE